MRRVQAVALDSPAISFGAMIDQNRTLPSAWYTDEDVFALEQRQIFCRRVNVEVAVHGPHVDGIRAELRLHVGTLVAIAHEFGTLPVITG